MKMHVRVNNHDMTVSMYCNDYLLYQTLSFLHSRTSPFIHRAFSAIMITSLDYVLPTM
jgi:hypothetical protein